MFLRSLAGRAGVFAAVVLLASTPGAAAQPRPTQDDVDAANKAAHKLLDAGRPAKAAEGFKKAIALAKQVYGPTHANVARTSGNLALAYCDDSRYDLAEPIYREVIDLFVANYKARRGQVTVREIGDAWLNLGDYYYQLGQWKMAELAAATALRVYESDGWNGPAAQARNNLGNVFERMGRYEEALKMHEASLAFRVKQFGTDDTRVGVALNNIAAVFSSAGQHDKAVAFYLKARAISDKHFGREKDHKLWRNLAWESLHLGRFAEAEERQAKGEVRRPEAGSLRMGVIKAYRGDWAAALTLIDKSVRAERADSYRTAGGLAEAEQVTYLQDFSGRQLSLALSVAHARRADPAAVAASAEWVLNAKNLIFELAAERALLARDAQLSGNAAAADELRVVRRLLAAHLDAGPASDKDEAWFDRHLELSEREGKLSRALAAGANRERGGAWVTLADVRKAIPAGEVLIEIKKIDLIDLADKGGPKGLRTEPRYLAWVIPPAGAGDVQFLDLGPAAPADASVAKLRLNVREYSGELFDAAVSALRREVRAGKLTPDEFEKRVAALDAAYRTARPKLEAEFRTEALELSRRVLHPLIAATASRRWVPSPDADLWLLPWAALIQPGKDGKYMVEDYVVRQAVTGRDLLAPVGPEAAGAPVLVVNPSYALGVTGPQNTRPFTQHALPQLDRFAHGKDEVRNVAANLKRLTGQAPVVKRGDAATETFVTGLRSPRYLLLATHGLFDKVPPDVAKPGFGYVNENPLYRCNLIFAGCDRVPAPGDADDGWLFGAEVLGCDLRGTELVSLCACQTAEGDVHASQAAVGMRSAFLLAGARRVEATLWSVGVAPTITFTEELFKLLADGRGAADAVTESQRAVRARWLADPGAAHPFNWAGYTLTVRGP